MRTWRARCRPPAGPPRARLASPLTVVSELRRSVSGSIVSMGQRDEGPAYALGHSERELERLGVQARLVDPVTRRFFVEAGVVSGMRVLDVGSGVGDVSFLAAELVGESGE